ncbi:MAG: sugar ABC transporter ATP-binding protein [Deltaproteobacteria bacterium]|nr:sugar ABC transporter ATP-binding protein [Deltaproteobacteria bacterium]
MPASKAADLARQSQPEIILQLSDISMLYPGTIALDRVSLEVRAGECHGIIGKNGAGKTTLMKIISGIISPSEGQIFIKKRRVKRLSRQKARKTGISIVTQEPQVIPEFTVGENLFYPDYPCKPGKRIDWNKIYHQAQETIAKANFDLSARAKASDLTISEQQLLLVLKAFYVDDDQVVILDEVTAALSQKDQEFLYDIIDHQKKRGKAILFISHRMGEVMRVCDRVTVLRDSKKITTEERSMLTEADLSRLIVGRDYAAELKVVRSQDEATACQEEANILSVQNLTKAGLFQDINFSLNRGQVVGLAGLRGSGRTEILKTIAGVFRPDVGSILIGGQEVKLDNPAQALKQGIAYLPEDRDQEGLIEILSLKFNLTLSSLGSLTRNLLIRKSKEEETAAGLVGTLSIRTASLDQEVSSLSGGNRQKVVIGRLMSASPQVFLLDEPTKGIDIEAKKKLLTTVREKLTRSAGVVLTSPSLEELILVSDRILVLFEGRIVRVFLKEEFNQGQIYLAMQGVAS